MSKNVRDADESDAVCRCGGIGWVNIGAALGGETDDWLCIDCIVERIKRLETFERDIRLAAGELQVPIPRPGSDMCRLMSANILLRRDNEKKHHAAVDRDRMVRWIAEDSKRWSILHRALHHDLRDDLPGGPDERTFWAYLEAFYGPCPHPSQPGGHDWRVDRAAPGGYVCILCGEFPKTEASAP